MLTHPDFPDPKCPVCDLLLVYPTGTVSAWSSDPPYCPKCRQEYEVKFTVVVTGNYGKRRPMIVYSSEP